MIPVLSHLFVAGGILRPVVTSLLTPARGAARLVVPGRVGTAGRWSRRRRERAAKTQRIAVTEKRKSAKLEAVGDVDVAVVAGVTASEFRRGCQDFGCSFSWRP